MLILFLFSSLRLLINTIRLLEQLLHKAKVLLKVHPLRLTRGYIIKQNVQNPVVILLHSHGIIRLTQQIKRMRELLPHILALLVEQTFE